VPNKPSKPCKKHSWILIPDGGWCPKCGPQSHRGKDRRPGASQRGYGAGHRSKRDDLLARYPWCVDPYGRHPSQRVKATIRDHIVPLGQGGTDDETNEQALCVQCHNYKIYRDGSR
jgi:5-methylcytosine-specific restriction protein A